MLSIVLACSVLACVGDAPVAEDRATGTLGARCFANGTCNAGLVCVVPDTCVAKEVDAGGPDVTPNVSTDAAAEAGPCSLLAWWRGDGDSSDERNVNPLTWVAGAQYASGFSFVGTNFLVGQKKLGAGALTIEARIKSIVANGTILSTDKQDGAGGGIWFGLSGGHLSARINKAWCQGNVQVVLAAWQHVAITYGSDTCTLFVGGTKDVLVAVPAGPITDEVVPYVGASASGAVQSELFNGVIADLAVWNRVLAADELAKLAAETPSVKCR